MPRKKHEQRGEAPLGRPKLKLSEEQKPLASKLAGIGCTVKQIAHILDISESTLERRLVEDTKLYDALDKGRAMAGAEVMKTAYQMAISGRNPFMTTFWLKCRLGWHEPKEAPLDEDDTFNLNYARPSKDAG